MLVEGSAEVAAVDGRGLTVLHYRETLQAPDIVYYLLHNGLQVDVRHEVVETVASHTVAVGGQLGTPI